MSVPGQGQEPNPQAGQEPGGATPPNADPQKQPTGPAPAGSDPKVETFDRSYVENLRREMADYRTRATAAEGKVTAHEREKLSETERKDAEIAELKTKATDLESRYQTALIRTAVEREAAKLGAVDPEVVYALIDRSDVKLTDSGDVTGADKAVKALLDAKPYLKADGKPVAQKGTPATPKPNGQQQTREERVAEAQKELRARAPIARL